MFNFLVDNQRLVSLIKFVVSSKHIKNNALKPFAYRVLHHGYRFMSCLEDCLKKCLINDDFGS